MSRAGKNSLCFAQERIWDSQESSWREELGKETVEVGSREMSNESALAGGTLWGVSKEVKKSPRGRGRSDAFYVFCL